MSNHPTQSDEDVRHLLYADAGEPPAELDADIRAAARDALAGESHRHEPAGRRRWRIPAAVGLAATVLLAVVVVDQVPRPTPEVASDAVEQSAPASPPSPSRTLGDRAKSMRAVEEAAPARMAGLRREPVCNEHANALSAAGMLVCVLEDQLDIHDVAAGECGDALRLERQSGEVSIGHAEDGLEILVDGEAAWQVGCANGVWELRRKASPSPINNAGSDDREQRR